MPLAVGLTLALAAERNRSYQSGAARLRPRTRAAGCNSCSFFCGKCLFMGTTYFSIGQLSLSLSHCKMSTAVIMFPAAPQQRCLRPPPFTIITIIGCAYSLEILIYYVHVIYTVNININRCYKNIFMF